MSVLYYTPRVPVAAVHDYVCVRRDQLVEHRLVQLGVSEVLVHVESATVGAAGHTVQISNGSVHFLSVYLPPLALGDKLWEVAYL